MKSVVNRLSVAVWLCLLAALAAAALWCARGMARSVMPPAAAIVIPPR